MKTKLKSMLAVALCAVGLAAFAEKPEISAVSEEGCADNPWDVGVGDEALHEKVKVKLTVSPAEPD